MTELLRRLHLDAMNIEYAIGDDQGVASSLLQQSVALDVERVRFGVPDDLVYAHLASSWINTRKVALEGNQKDVLAVDAGWVDGRIEGNRQTCLEAESVQGIDGVQVVAIRDLYAAIGMRRVHPPSGVLSRVRDREQVARKRPPVRLRQIKSGHNTRWSF